MATKNIVPRTGSQGQLGTDTKPWKRVVADSGSFDYVSGSVFVVGDVTASKFKGDGSGLTNVNAGGIEFSDINNKDIPISGSWRGALSGSLNLISGSGISTASFGRIEVASITASGVIRADGFQSKTGGAAIEFSDAISSTGDVTATGGTLGNIRVGVTGDNEIDTSAGNLTLDSTGGSVIIDDKLSVAGEITASGAISSSNSITASAFKGDGSGLTNVAAGSIAYTSITGAPSQSLASRVTNLKTNSGSFSTRVTNLKTDSGSFSTRTTTLETTMTAEQTNIDNLQSDSGSFSTRVTNLKTDSGSFSTRLTSNNTDSSSFATRITQATASISAATASISSLVTRIGTEETNVDNLQAIDLTAGTGLSGGGDLTDNRTFDINFSDSDLQSAISGSLGSNATLIRSLTATGISGSLGSSATLIRTLTAAGITGSTVLAEGSSQGQITHNSVAVNVNALGTDDTPTFAGLTSTGDVTIQGKLTAEVYAVSSSVTHMTRSFSSGSTIFGDDSNDTHQFTGSVFLSGSITQRSVATASFGELLVSATGNSQFYSDFSQSIQSRVASAVAGGVTSVAGGTGISSTGGNTPTIAIDFTDSDLKSGISGSFTAPSSSFSTRTTNLKTDSGSFSTRTTNLKTDSGSFSTRTTALETTMVSEQTNIDNLQSDSGSFSTRTTNLKADSGSFSTRITNEEANVDALQARQIISGVGLKDGGDLTADRTLNIDFSDSDLQSAISGSLGSNATLIRSLTATGISGSLGSNATLIRTLTAAGISGSLGSNAALIRTLNATGITGSTVLAEGSAQGQITHNGSAINVNALGTNDSPTFAGLKSTSGLTSTGSLLISGSITQQGGFNTTFTASFGRIEAKHISASKLFVDSDSIVIGGVEIGQSVASNIQALDQAVNTTSDVQFSSIELGNASDTTIARSDAGVVTIEGAVVRTGTVAVNVGGTGATDASTARTNLGLGSSDNVTFAQVTASSALINGNITGSGTSTASFGTYLGDGSQLSGIVTSPFPFTGSGGIEGDLSIRSNHSGAGTLSVSKTGSFGAISVSDGKAGVGIGADRDLLLYHDGNNSYIKDNGAGGLRYRGGTQTFQNGDGTKTMMVLNAANTVDLHYNDVKKFETTRTGINVTGAITASSIDIDSIQGNWTNAGNTVADLGTITTVDINGGTINGITDLAIADGGTGASNISDARTNLLNGSGIVSGSSIASSAQGQFVLTTNDVAASAVDLGLQTGDSPTFANLTLSGNLTVNGTTTTVNSTTVDIGDRIIELNAASAAGMGGVYVRDADGNQTGSLVWDPANNYWLGGITGSEVKLSTISATETLTNKTLTSPDINTPDIDGGTIDGTLIGGSSANRGVFTQVTASGNISSSATGSFGRVQASAIGGNSPLVIDADQTQFSAPVTMSGGFRIDSLTANRVPFATTNGRIVDDSDFTFSTDTLTVTKIGAFEAAGAINFNSQAMTNVDINSGTITGITDLAVADGGTGASEFTDGGVLLGSGTNAITATAVLGNGELLIGDNSTDPTVGTLTGTANQITVTNGAGSITLATPQDIHTSAKPTFAQITGSLFNNGFINSTNNALFVDTTNKTVGIGKKAYGSTSTNGAWFSDLAGSNGYVQISVNGTNEVLSLNQNSTGPILLGKGSGTEKFRVNVDGNVTASLGGKFGGVVQGTKIQTSNGGGPQLVNSTPNGTTPSIYPSMGDTNTGIGYGGADGSTADNINLITGGTTGLYIDSSQNVVIPAGNLSVTGNTTLGDASGDTVTINAETIDLANIAAGTDNSVVVYNGSSLVTDEIDSRVWGSTLLDTDGTGTDNELAIFTDSNTVEGSANLTYDGTRLVVVGHVSASEVSSSTYYGDGSNLTGISAGFPFTGSAGISGSLSIDRQASNSGSTIFDIKGTQGTLFSVVDEMSGSIFTATTIAGLPVIEAFSDSRVKLGPISNRTSIDTSGNIDIGGNISGSGTSTGSFGSLVSSGESTFGGQLRIPAGSVTEPAIVFSDDDDGGGTGIYRGGANNIRMTINGTKAFELDGSRNLDIDGDITTTDGTFSGDIVSTKTNGVISGSSTSTGSFGRVNASTIDIDSIQGNWTNAGNTVADLGTITTVDINGGTIDGITSLTAGGDLDIGSHDLRAATLTADGLTSGRVVFAGTNGVLSDDSDFSFSTDTLTVTKLGAFQAVGAIDFNSQAMTNVDINSGTINGITDLAIADGGTGASTAAAARVNLNAGSGIVSGSSVASSAQGQFVLTTNDVAASAVDLGLQTGDSPTFASLTLSGNLTVNGTTTTVNSTEVSIGDKIITLNAGSAAGDGGIYVNDADTTETGSLLWDVSTDRWIGGLKDAEVNLVTISSTDTLTNKTLTSPDINAGTVDSITSLTTGNIAGAVDLKDGGGNTVITYPATDMSGDAECEVKIGDVDSATTGTFLSIKPYGEEISFGGADLLVSGEIKHIGDTDTKINFTDDQIRFTVGNAHMLTLDEGSSDNANFVVDKIDIGSALISGSTSSTGSFGKVLVGSSNLVRSGSSLFEVVGNQGTLFNVTDEMSGSIFSANTVAGLPVIEAFSDQRVKIGRTADPITVKASSNNETFLSGSAQSTASFGRIQASTIGGNSPLTVEASNFTIDADGTFSGSAQATASFGVLQGKLEGSKVVISVPSIRSSRFRGRSPVHIDAGTSEDGVASDPGDDFIVSSGSFFKMTGPTGGSSETYLNVIGSISASTGMYAANHINLGHDTDTTITRASSGDIAIEGNTVYRAGGTNIPVSDGGTGASSFADKSVIITQDSGTDTLAAVAMSTNGQLLIGGSDGPAVSTLTAGSNVTITNGNGAITIASTDTNTMGSGFTVSADTNTATTTITQGDTLTIAGGTNVSTVSNPDGTITITSTDTNTMGTGFTVSATTDTTATTITQGDDLFFAAGAGITCETTADGTVTITNTSLASSVTRGTLGVDTDDDVRFDSLGIGMNATGTTGQIDAAADVIAYSSSDRRWKENLIRIPNPLDKIGKISGYEFDWKELTDEERKTQHSRVGHDVGVVAQEIQEVLPEVVKERDNGYLAVDYEKIVPLLIESIKELKSELDELKKKV